MAVDFPGLVAWHRKYVLSGTARTVEWREALLDALHALMDLRRNRRRSWQSRSIVDRL
jgi:hypothetical protein